ncbi:unnamed protein product, partial [marine sediment metagenome]
NSPFGKEELALGLPIAKELVEMHNGWIWAESKDGRGNSFCFTLPKTNTQAVTASTSAEGTKEQHQS